MAFWTRHLPKMGCTDLNLLGNFRIVNQFPRTLPGTGASRFPKDRYEIACQLGRASAQRLKKVLVDSGGGDMRSANYVDGPLEHCEVRRALGSAPHVPIVSTSAASEFHEKLQAGLVFLDDIISLRAMDAYSKYTFRVRGNPQEVRDAVGVA